MRRALSTVIVIVCSLVSVSGGAERVEDPHPSTWAIDGPKIVPFDPYVREGWFAERLGVQQVMVGTSELAAPRAELHNPRLDWRRTRAQGVMLARIFISEDSRSLWPYTSDGPNGPGLQGALSDDHHRIAHVVLNNSTQLPGVEGWLDVMRQLSPNVTRSKTLSRPRQRWTSTLPSRGIAVPDGWRGSPEVWDEVCADNWARFRDQVIYLWLTLGFDADIGGKPIAWGNEADVARGMRIRGLVRVECESCLNGFLARPTRGIPAKVAARGYHRSHRAVR